MRGYYKKNAHAKPSVRSFSVHKACVPLTIICVLLHSAVLHSSLLLESKCLFLRDLLLFDRHYR